MATIQLDPQLTTPQPPPTPPAPWHEIEPETPVTTEEPDETASPATEEEETLVPKPWHE
jgi:hypothetical protein